MKARHQVSRNAVELIKRFEGLRANAAQLPDGRWTIGYGHTLTAREGAVVTGDDAEALLLYDLIAVAHAVNEHSYTPLNQNQFDALVSFAFNIGVENFRRSAVLRRLNEGALIQAACAMEMWRKADFAGERIVIDALVRRRSAEKTLFLTPPDGWVAAPSPILPPKVDYDASYSVPRQSPTAVTASLIGDRAEARLEDAPGVAPAVPEEDAAPTASERAAAAVGARLEALLPEAEPPPAPAPAPAPAPISLVSEPVRPLNFAFASDSITPTPAEQRQIEQAAAESATPAAPAEAEPAPVVEAPKPEAPLAEGEPSPAENEAPPAPPATGETAVAWTFGVDDERPTIPGFETAARRKPRKGGQGGALLLLFVSLALIAGGLFGGLNAAPDPFSGYLTTRSVSWMLGGVGALGFLIAAYMLLRRLDRDS